jgi:hypothetical protein
MRDFYRTPASCVANSQQARRVALAADAHYLAMGNFARSKDLRRGLTILARREESVGQRQAELASLERELLDRIEKNPRITDCFSSPADWREATGQKARALVEAQADLDATRDKILSFCSDFIADEATNGNHF